MFGAKRRTWGLVERISGKFLGACWTDFLTNCSLSELIFGPNLGFLNWIVTDFQAWEHEKWPNLGIFSRKFKFCDFWLKRGSCGTEICWKRGLVERLRGVKKGVLSAGHPYHPFQGKYPPPGTCYGELFGAPIGSICVSNSVSNSISNWNKVKVKNSNSRHFGFSVTCQLAVRKLFQNWCKYYGRVECRS